MNPATLIGLLTVVLLTLLVLSALVGARGIYVQWNEARLWKALALKRAEHLEECELELDDANHRLEMVEQATAWDGNIVQPHVARVIIAKAHVAAVGEQRMEAKDFDGKGVDWDAIKIAQDNTREPGYVEVQTQKVIRELRHEKWKAIRTAAELMTGLEIANARLQHLGHPDQVVKTIGGAALVRPIFLPPKIASAQQTHAERLLATTATRSIEEHVNKHDIIPGATQACAHTARRVNHVTGRTVCLVCATEL